MTMVCWDPPSSEFSSGPLPVHCQRQNFSDNKLEDSFTDPFQIAGHGSIQNYYVQTALH
jgi:hypothetical protein